jgi:hypothetical protein
MTFEDYQSMTRWIRENGPLPPSRAVRVGERVILDGESGPPTHYDPGGKR